MMRSLCLIALVLTSGCNTGIYVRDGVTDGDTFYLAPVASVDDDPALQSWVAYSLMRSVCQLEMGGDNPARQSSFDCELRARTALVDTWAEQRTDKPGLDDPYLDELADVRAAGFLDEYTAFYLSRDTWQVPAGVDVDAFDAWRRRHLHGHRPQTRLVGSWGYQSPAARSLSETR